MTRRFMIRAFLWCSLVCVGGALVASHNGLNAQSTDFTLRLTDEVAVTGSTATVKLELDATQPVEGFTIVLCYDSTKLSLSSWQIGADQPACPTCFPWVLQDPGLFGYGLAWAGGTVSALPPGVGYEMMVFQFEVLAPGPDVVPIEYCFFENTETLIFAGQSSVSPVLETGSVQILPSTDAWVRGDCNADGSFNIGDAVAGLGALFGSNMVPCDGACDSNDDGSFNLADAVHTLSALFGSGPNPRAPHPDCGADPTPDGLSCLSFALCP